MPQAMDIVIGRVDEAEVDEMWSVAEKKKNQRWLWYAIDHCSGQV
jgi:IS1 family transposase